MIRQFKFFGENNTMVFELPVPIEITSNHLNNFSYYSENPLIQVGFQFQWVNQYEYRELEVSRLVTFVGDVIEFSNWYDRLMENIDEYEFLPIYPPIYQIRIDGGNNILDDGDVNILHVYDSTIAIDVKIYRR